MFDPSELRTDVTGKVVRYLQDNGANVEAGQPFVEVEAMKMIMPIKSSESGKITHNLSPGSVINAGDLLASLELKDPSKVKKILSFEGSLDIPKVEVEIEPDAMVANILAGFEADPEAAAQAALGEATDLESAAEVVTKALNEFIRVESIFAGKLKDDVVRELTKANEGNLDVVIAENQAHQQLPMRTKLILAMLRQVESFNDRFGLNQIPDGLLEALEKLATMEGKEYGELALSADTIIRQSKVPPFEDRVNELRALLVDPSTKLDELARSPTLSAGVDLLTYLFADEDAAVRAKALETYVRRMYRAHRIENVIVNEADRSLTCSWTFRFSDIEESESVARRGMLTVVPSLDKLDFSAVLDNFGSQESSVDASLGPLNDVQIAVVDGKMSKDLSEIEKIFTSEQSKLKMLGVRQVSLLIPVAKKDPQYYTFPHVNGFKEEPFRRNMRPTLHHVLELARLSENFDLERLPSINKNVQVYVGSERDAKPVRGPAPQVVFVRGLSHSPGLITEAGARRALLQGLDELERAQSSAKVNPQASSRIFLHSLVELEDVSAEEIAIRFKDMMGRLKSQLATRLLKLRVDEIEVKLRIATIGSDGKPVNQSIRLVASSMEGEWLKTTAFLEKADPVTGITAEYCVLGEDSSMCFLDPYVASSTVQTKRAIARRVGSTYAYDFLGLMEVGLIGEWDTYLSEQSKDPSTNMPSNLFESQELLGSADGELVLGSRPIGSNKIGMVAWLVKMKTPEYPEGREVVVIANDVTVQSGSFGVQEDEFYYKASKFARERKLPRIYLSCNAGARIGLVDELKPKLKIKFNDEENPTKGFEYLYLSDEDYKALPEGAVIAHKVPEGWALDDVVGTEHGIGVENLQGSGKIAGETSKAYDEIFTLSYVTGRSVGIGAYLVRLGQRVIQMKQGPIILTGYSALNKLLGREVYTSQDQLGGPQIMIPNGVSHLQVENDQEGVDAILKWLSFVPKNVGALPASRKSADPVDRDVEWRPTPTPYDPRLMLAGTQDMAGFFDKGSFKEYLAGWGKSVIVGRGRLGGIPMGAIAVETRLVDRVIPADPADPNSREAVLPQAGQVLFPDSSYKTAQAIRDFDKEGLPIMIFANWRGFSGGSRDMAGEILKFGAMIVDALREYSNPVYIYLPPHGELRGGSWVVVDPTINPEEMEMYADPDSRGGILEPAGITEVKFRLPDQLKIMHRLDPQLQLLDAELEMTDLEDDQNDIKAQIKAREDLLKPVYLQAATEFADLHDKTGRMKAKGVIKAAVPWKRSREFFYYRAQRRIVEDDYIGKLQTADPSLTKEKAETMLRGMYSGDWEDNKSVVKFFEEKATELSDLVKTTKAAAVQAQIESLQKELNSMDFM